MAAAPAEPEDPVLEARVERALAPYKDVLTPEALAEARLLLSVTLTTHPDIAPLMDRLRQGLAKKGDAPETSGVVVKDDGGESRAAPKAPGRGGRKR